ncbi:MAG: response regulator [Myxococcales bacterium]|jgi:CheY-like chemotaxis protein|nr:MAG: response regulator [Myxococcales bacterium]
MKTALVIDDHVWMRRLACEFLQERSYETIEACDCATALGMLADVHVDIVITDILMAGMDGMEFIARLQRDRPELPIVAVSAGGGASRPYLDTALALGASAAVEKPFEPHELLEPVDRLLNA